jgi:hypothetical protein
VVGKTPARDEIRKLLSLLDVAARNLEDFRSEPIVVYSPQETLAQLKAADAGDS